MNIPAQFQSFRIHNDADGYRSGIEPISLDNLAPGEVVIKTAYSSVNYKDALAGTGQGKILRKFPLVGGIDVAGHVIASTDPKVREGDAVLVTGCGLSETRDGGYSEYARLESQWVIPLPDGLSLRESMILENHAFAQAQAVGQGNDPLRFEPRVFTVAPVARFAQPAAGDQHGIAFADLRISGGDDVARDIDAAHQREFAQDLALAGTGEGVLVVDGGVSRFDHDFAGSEIVERYRLDAAAIAVGVVVDAERLE